MEREPRLLRGEVRIGLQLVGNLFEGFAVATITPYRPLEVGEDGITPIAGEKSQPEHDQSLLTRVQKPFSYSLSSPDRHAAQESYRGPTTARDRKTEEVSLRDSLE
jgi:hypothetical protein